MRFVAVSAPTLAELADLLNALGPEAETFPPERDGCGWTCLVELPVPLDVRTELMAAEAALSLGVLAGVLTVLAERWPLSDEERASLMRWLGPTNDLARGA